MLKVDTEDQKHTIFINRNINSFENENINFFPHQCNLNFAFYSMNKQIQLIHKRFVCHTHSRAENKKGSIL